MRLHERACAHAAQRQEHPRVDHEHPKLEEDDDDPTNYYYSDDYEIHDYEIHDYD